MYLKKIRLLGFKSFCDPQVLELNAPISAVVGPNGCGKSNIIDAVKCLTGQSKAKEMRGEQISDLIFNGSDQRHPVGQAQVELVFDNRQQILKGPFAHYQEVAVKRIIGRDGQSTFYINQTRCRRRDVIDLFTGTGLGPQSYAIIEQGMIARFIEAKPAQVRGYIEEVAGISRYKERRKETLSQLESSRENLTRLYDIQGELTQHVASLAQQAAEASQYQALKERLISYRQQHHAHLYQQCLSQEIKAQEHFQAAQESHTEKAQALRQLSQEHAQYEQEHEKESEHLAALQKEQHQLQLLIEQKKSQWQQAKQRRQFLEQDCQQWGKELQQIQEQMSTLETTLTASDNPWHALEQQSRQALQEMEQARAQRATAQQQHQEALALWQKQKDTAHALTQKISQQQLRLEHQKSELQRLKRTMVALEEQIAALEQEERDLDLTLLETAATQADEHLTKAQKELQDHQEQQRLVKKTMAQEQWQLEQLKKSLSQAEKESQKMQALLKARHSAMIPWLDFTSVVEMGPNHYPSEQQGFLTALATTALFHGGQIPPTERWEQLAERDVEYVFGEDNQPSYWAHLLPCATFDEAQSRQKDLASYEALLLPGGALLGPNWFRPQRQRSEPLLADLEKAATDAEQHYAELVRQQKESEKNLTAALEQERQLSQKQPALSKAVLELEKQAQQAQHALIRSQQRRTDITQRLAEKKHSLSQTEQQTHESCTLIEQLERSSQELSNDNQVHASELENFHQKERKAYEDLLQIGTLCDDATSSYQNISAEVERLKMQRQQQENQYKQLQHRSQEISQKLQSKREQWAQSQAPIENLEQEMASDLTLQEMGQRRLNEAQQQLQEQQKELEARYKQQRHAAIARDKAHEAVVQAQMILEKQQLQKQHVQDQILDHGWTIEQIQHLTPEHSFETIKKEMALCQKEFEALGPVNLRAIAEHEQQQQRLEQMTAQCGDLEEATAQIEKALHELDCEMQHLFTETFSQLQKNFEELFPILFGGGKAQLILQKSEQDEEAGVIIQAQPPGKKNATISLLSGGEKALTAAALLFAFFQLNPAPFCLLDEIDAPLDDSNTARLGQMIARLSDKTQFIIVTHSKVMMEFASSLYGVTMKEPGVSRLVSVTLDEALEVVGEEA